MAKVTPFYGMFFSSSIVVNATTIPDIFLHMDDETATPVNSPTPVVVGGEFLNIIKYIP